MSNLRWQCFRKGCYLEHLSDWSIFNGLLPRGIRFTDLDGVVEIGGRFLAIEWKTPGAPISTGQRLMYKRMVAAGDWTVVVVWGTTAPDMTPETWLILDADSDSGVHPVTLDELQAFVQVWGRSADTVRSIR